ncbi:response regulator transcription factor [Flavobacterium sediminilitoris]|uniref:Response regulator transcription factor n=1 Tax=Flavobacterium sediminilitoris TaxID=2024526 RepID=A0ABY4HQ68_9FLAO|nr:MULTISPECIES: response regulator transcription factor [Flavobacterium]UOX34327.1 response regulator transcription factor [Flavobacterium sediminilitoris]
MKTLLVDDHMLFLEGLESILESYGELDLLPPVTRGKEALEIILNTTVDFLITDLNLPDVSGVDLILKIKKEKPQIPILVLSMDCDRKEVKSILNAGSEGFILKIAGKQELCRAIHKIINGGTYYSSEITAIMMEIINNKSGSSLQTNCLTVREMEILDLICKEYSNKEISEKLFISISTIETHRSSMFCKTGSKNVVGLVRYAVENELVTW